MSRQTYTKADGVKGCILGDYFRIYKEDGSFKDYYITIDDLFVTIDDESFAEFIDTEGEEVGILDHSRQVLGYEEE